MYFVSSRGENHLVGITDTKDWVEDFFTVAQVKEIVTKMNVEIKGVSIDPRGRIRFSIISPELIKAKVYKAQFRLASGETDVPYLYERKLRNGYSVYTLDLGRYFNYQTRLNDKKISASCNLGELTPDMFLLDDKLAPILGVVSVENWTYPYLRFGYAPFHLALPQNLTKIERVAQLQMVKRKFRTIVNQYAYNPDAVQGLTHYCSYKGIICSSIPLILDAPLDAESIWDSFVSANILGNVTIGRNTKFITKSFINTTVSEVIFDGCVISFGEDVFYNNSNLDKIVFKEGSLILDGGIGVFYNCPNAVMYIPKETAKSTEIKKWGIPANRIVVY